ncbi:hypothetical protein CICLE_v10010129mg [Citrus x clementina]|uniref:Uncharacterized protein n=1 Tax=Citrus clementina TaxID=85681 RepID=V4UQB6_CITCL|nr:hypothetical protein CICLE_v10010129mg [Citrus x clementina]ESR64630.1 hypothetical protein CICLE_v10010129mg [Citrus x clementina]ESR64631.1 hypothetical protein CICLE_v10010129mg [Citrus x clementina]ESR64632.1 hypothetical protein CICLE_v10010129mg [Citrus x clementina]
MHIVFNKFVQRTVQFIVIQYSEEDDFMSNLYQKLEKEMHKMVAVFSNETGTTAKAQVNSLMKLKVLG